MCVCICICERMYKKEKEKAQSNAWRQGTGKKNEGHGILCSNFLKTETELHGRGRIYETCSRMNQGKLLSHGYSLMPRVRHTSYTRIIFLEGYIRNHYQFWFEKSKQEGNFCFPLYILQSFKKVKRCHFLIKEDELKSKVCSRSSPSKHSQRWCISGNPNLSPASGIEYQAFPSQASSLGGRFLPDHVLPPTSPDFSSHFPSWIIHCCPFLRGFLLAPVLLPVLPGCRPPTHWPDQAWPSSPQSNRRTLLRIPSTPAAVSPIPGPSLGPGLLPHQTQLLQASNCGWPSFVLGLGYTFVKALFQ